ncbi:MAG TPA: glycosyl hydrolase [Opitutaceae bacterium]|nr:glycosyl hydrolase [Opitutaceae bacterium]
MKFCRLFSRIAVLTVAVATLSSAVYGAEPDPLLDGFLNPPASAKPRTFWHWMNGNVTRDGITRDLEAMQRVGIGGAMIFDGSTYLPAGPAGYLNDEWRALMTHAIREGNRLGIEIGMHNAPGWSSSGGPWITPERSMQQLVWTETTLQGGRRVDISLAQPQTNAGFYRDARVIAFPALQGEERRYEDQIARITTSAGKTVSKDELSDRQLTTTATLDAGESLIVELTEPAALHALSVWPSADGKFPRLQVDTSADGKSYSPLCAVSNPGRHSIVFPAVRTFPVVTAKFVRFHAKTDGEVAEVILHRAPRLPNWPAKANFDYRVFSDIAIPAADTKEGAIDPTRVVDISAQLHGDRLTWDAPPGAWTILRIGHTTTGKENVAASAAGRGLESDKLNPSATEFHFAHVIEKVLADSAAAGVKGPSAVAIDSYEAGMQNWTEKVPEEFERRAGYPLFAYMPALFGRIVGSVGITERFLFDFRRVQADMMAEYYYGRMGELAAGKGLKFFVEGYGPGNFDELKVSGSAEVPMGEFWTRTPWTPNRAMKMVTSAAHVYGKSVVAAESFTGEAQTSRWLEYPYALKILGDEMFAQGLNQMVFHRYAHQPHPDAVPGMTMGPWGFHFDRTNTWFEQSREWLAYLTRTQFLLRQGVYVADVLYFTGEHQPNGSQYAMPVLPPGYTYDLVNADVVLNRIRVDNGDWVLPEGGRYRLLVLPPELKNMTPKLAERLEQLVGQGGTLLGPKPVFSPTLSGYPASEYEMRRCVDRFWSGERRGGGRVLVGRSIAEALEELEIAPDVEYRGARTDTSIAWEHRRVADGEMYFLGNRQRRVEDVVVSFRGMADRQPEIWRPETKERGESAIYSFEKDRVLVPLRLEPAESVFVLFRRSAPAGATALVRDGQPLIEAKLPSPNAADAKGADASESFTMAIWVKPDTDLRVMPQESTQGRIDEVGKFYAIPADPGDLRFGAGHATAGLAVGRNGVFVVERSSERCPAVLVAPVPISGWAHVAVVYHQGTPSLYLNGKWVRDGLRSGQIVHSGVGAPPPPVDYTLYFPGIEALTRSAGRAAPPSRGQVFFFEGNSVPPQSFDRALSPEEIGALVQAGIPAPPLPVVTRVRRGPAGHAEALVWQSGKYALAGGSATTVDVASGTKLEGPWIVSFQSGRGAPPQIELPELRSLHLHPDPGVKYFSGTANYRHTLSLDHAPSSRPGERVVLDLGRVEVVADVYINGRKVATLWKEPYRTDVTDFVHEGENKLEVRVTDLWTNRLIGDEQLPAEDQFGLHDERGENPQGIVRLPEWYQKGLPKPAGGRTTFATWKFYDKDDPLVASGLLGPVRVLFPRRVELAQ